MDLSEIEDRAESLALDLCDTESKNEALLLGIKLEGLRDLAQIKAVRDNRSRWDVSVEMRQQEVAAMETAAAAADKAARRASDPDVLRCGHRWQWGGAHGQSLHFEICTLPVGHKERLHSNQVTGVTTPVEEPTKHVADRLHELVSYGRSTAGELYVRGDNEPELEGQHRNTAKAFANMADKLEEILTEGGI